MKNCDCKVEVSIQKPAAEVFDAVVNPQKLAGYFIESSTGPLKEGTNVTWKFPEFDMEVTVRVTEVVPHKSLHFQWEGEAPGQYTDVEMSFVPFGAKVTTVTVHESGWTPTDRGRKASFRNCGGWMHMICCMKAYLEYGINLRTGSFVHMQGNVGH